MLTSDIPVLVMFTNKDIKSIEKDDEGEEDERNPRKIWLKWRLEDEGITVNTLSLERLVELDIGNAN